MIAQFSFLLFMHILGVLFALPLRKTLSLPFICISGLLWGGLFYVLGSMALLVSGLPYQRDTLALLFGLLTLILLAWNLASGSLSFKPAELRRGIAWLSLPVVIFAVSSTLNLTMISPDSLVLILNGRAFSTEGFSVFVREQLALRGVFIQALQAAGPILGQDYLYALQPAFTLLSAVLFPFFGWRILKQITPTLPPVWPFFLGLLGMAGTYFIPFQTFYIHTNLLSGCYLMVGLASFWLALQEKNDIWLIFGVLAMTAFSLLRTEAPLFALVFFALLFSFTEIPYRVRLAAYLPFGLLISAWYLYLLAGTGRSYILNPANIWAVVLALLSFGLLLGISRFRWIETRFLPHLPWMAFIGAVGLCGVLAVMDPPRMAGFFETALLNMTLYGLWGITWFLVILGLAFTTALPAIPYQRIFSFGIPVFLILLLAVSTLNVNYQLDWGDSANRMLTHIFPTIFLYCSVRFSHAFYAAQWEIIDLKKNRSPLLIAFGSGLVVFILVLLLIR